MADAGGSVGRRRVYLPQALGSDEHLRVTWHDDRDLVVFSQWMNGTCVAAIPVRRADIAELTALLDDVNDDHEPRLLPPPTPLGDKSA